LVDRFATTITGANESFDSDWFVLQHGDSFLNGLKNVPARREDAVSAKKQIGSVEKVFVG